MFASNRYAVSFGYVLMVNDMKLFRLTIFFLLYCSSIVISESLTEMMIERITIRA